MPVEMIVVGDARVSLLALRELCQKWRIAKLSLFGSAMTGRQTTSSDIDLLVDFEPGERWSLMDLVCAEQEFASLLGRPVELVDRAFLIQSSNWVRRDSILGSEEAIYAA